MAMTPDWPGMQKLAEGMRRFRAKPFRAKCYSVLRRWQRWFPATTIPLRLPFGAWWLARASTLDDRLLFGEFETAEIRFVDRYLRPGMTVLDIGAHHGLYTLLASKRVTTKGKVIAFEPSPRERQRLESHVRINSCSNVRIEPIALGSRTEQAELYIVHGAEDWCNSLRPPAIHEQISILRVDVLPLDEYLTNAGIRAVDFIKLDVEGAELDVLRGAQNLLQMPPRPVILAEIQDRRTKPWGYSARDIVVTLDALNYLWFQPLPNGTLVQIGVERGNFDANLVAVPRERQSEVAACSNEDGSL